MSKLITAKTPGLEIPKFTWVFLRVTVAGKGLSFITRLFRIIAPLVRRISAW